MMPDVLEGRMSPMPADPRALHEGTRAIVLVVMILAATVAILPGAYLAGIALGHTLL